MKRLVSLILVLSLAGCATCKSSDSPEVCRTKQRDRSQPRALTDLAPAQNSYRRYRPVTVNTLQLRSIQAAVASNGLR